MLTVQFDGEFDIKMMTCMLSVHFDGEFDAQFQNVYTIYVRMHSSYALITKDRKNLMVVKITCSPRWLQCANMASLKQPT